MGHCFYSRFFLYEAQRNSFVLRFRNTLLWRVSRRHSGRVKWTFSHALFVSVGSLRCFAVRLIILVLCLALEITLHFVGVHPDEPFFVFRQKIGDKLERHSAQTVHSIHEPMQLTDSRPFFPCVQHGLFHVRAAASMLQVVEQLLERRVQLCEGGDRLRANDVLIVVHRGGRRFGRKRAGWLCEVGCRTPSTPRRKFTFPLFLFKRRTLRGLQHNGPSKARGCGRLVKIFLTSTWRCRVRPHHLAL